MKRLYLKIRHLRTYLKHRHCSPTIQVVTYGSVMPFGAFANPLCDSIHIRGGLTEHTIRWNLIGWINHEIVHQVLYDVVGHRASSMLDNPCAARTASYQWPVCPIWEVNPSNHLRIHGE